MIKVNHFHLRSTIISMARKILVDVGNSLLYEWVQNGLEDLGCGC